MMFAVLLLHLLLLFAVKQDWSLMILSFMFLHSIEITNIVTSNENIAVTNRKSISNKIIEKEIFARQFLFCIGMPFLQIKNFLLLLNLVNKVF